MSRRKRKNSKEIEKDQRLVGVSNKRKDHELTKGEKEKRGQYRLLKKKSRRIFSTSFSKEEEQLWPTKTNIRTLGP